MNMSAKNAIAIIAKALTEDDHKQAQKLDAAVARIAEGTSHPNCKAVLEMLSDALSKEIENLG